MDYKLCGNLMLTYKAFRVSLTLYHDVHRDVRRRPQRGLQLIAEINIFNEAAAKINSSWKLEFNNETRAVTTVEIK